MHDIRRGGGSSKDKGCKATNNCQGRDFHGTGKIWEEVLENERIRSVKAGTLEGY
jgi:hypothetical protein